MKFRFSMLVATFALLFLPLASWGQEKASSRESTSNLRIPTRRTGFRSSRARAGRSLPTPRRSSPPAILSAGTGLFTRKFAAEVGEKGKVFAVDIAPKFLAHIKKTCEEGKVKNVETILCDQFSIKLPKNSVDLVFICDTYHHFEFPQRTLQSIHDALRPGGQIVLIDFHRIKGKSSDFVMGHVRAGQEVFVREIKASGFKVIGEEKILKENYFVRLREGGAGKGQTTKRSTRTARKSKAHSGSLPSKLTARGQRKRTPRKSR